MNMEQHSKVLAFAKRAKVTGAKVHLRYGTDFYWHATVESGDESVDLTAPEGGGWPRIEGLMQILVGSGVEQAEITFKGMPPIYFDRVNR